MMQTGAHLSEFTNRTAYNLDNHARRMVSDPYHDLLKESAALLVAHGKGRASYKCGWGTATLWEQGTPEGKTENILVRPHDGTVDSIIINETTEERGW